MPKVMITYDPKWGDYMISDAWEKDPTEYQVIVDMKASHFKNIRRNEDRVVKDQEFLERFFISAQMAGREIRER